MKSDLISRSAAMKSLSKVFGIPLDYDGNCDEMCDEAFAAIDALPSIYAVPVVHARWIPIKLYGRDHAIKCSACNNCDNPSKVPGRYCWQCGARMDEDESV